MSTKIIVVHLKQVIKNTVFALVGVAIILLIVYWFLPSKSEDSVATSLETAENINTIDEKKYKAGTYSTSIYLDETPITVDVKVDKNEILEVTMSDLTEDQMLLYPLLEPTMADISTQVVEKQNTSDVSIQKEKEVTSKVLLDAINVSIEKASS